MSLSRNNLLNWAPLLLVPVTAVGARGLPQAQDDVPQALRNMHDYRASLRTGVVSYSKQQFVDGKPWFRYWTARFADEGLIVTQRGDEAGVVARTVEGDPFPLRKGPLHYFKGADETWMHFEDEVRTRVWPNKGTAMVSDLRTLGLMPDFSYIDLASTIFRDHGSQPGTRTYTEEIDGAGLHVVTAKVDDRTIRWRIDPKRGWSPVHVELYVRGELWLESRTSLAEFDGVWFPQTVHYYAKAHKDGTEPFISIEVQSAEFNRPEHPLRLTPRDIGLKVGAPLNRVDSEGGELGIGLFDGERMVSAEEFARQRKEEAARDQTGAAPPGQAAAAPPGQPGRRPEDWETEWQAYTRRFIEKYKLNEEQTQRARQILADCEQSARQIVRRIEPELSDLTEQLTAARKAADEQLVQRLTDRRSALCKPIDEIFEKQLKPRLDKLPTRAQRAAAEGTDGAKPGQKPDSTSAGRP